VLTLFSLRFTPALQEWWYSRHPRSMDEVMPSALIQSEA